MSADVTRVLVVEDSPTQAMELAVLLQHAGFTVSMAGSLAEAMEVLDRGPVDVVLLDLLLPDASELSALDALTARVSDVPVVVLTSVDDERLAVEAVKSGAEDYVFKGTMDDTMLVRSVRYAMERHRTRTELLHMTEELRRLNAQKTQFLGIAAHDLRNPLSVIRAYSDFLRNGAAGPVNEEQVEILGSVRRSSDFMLRLVEDLLDFSRIDRGQLELERADVDLPVLVRRSVAMNGMLAQKKGIEIILERVDDLPAMSLDAHKIEQVLDNLLTNAIKFSHPGSRVEVWLTAEGPTAVLCVRDHGVGIPAEDLEKVFAPFAKTQARPTGGERSTGLGLAIVRNIVEAHGGTIELAETAVGEGSTFRVALPL